MPYDRRGAVSLWPAPSFFSDYPRLTQTLPTAPQLVNADSAFFVAWLPAGAPLHVAPCRQVHSPSRPCTATCCLGLDGFLGSRPWATDPAFQQHTNGEYRARPLHALATLARPANIKS